MRQRAAPLGLGFVAGEARRWSRGVEGERPKGREPRTLEVEGGSLPLHGANDRRGRARPPPHRAKVAVSGAASVPGPARPGVSAASGGLVLRDELDGLAFFLVPARGDR